MNKNVNIFKSIGWNAINSVFRLIIGVLSTVLLSRLLAPDDFGTYGILLIFITVAELLADSGMAGYIVKAKTIQEEDYDTLFVYNLTMSIVLYAALYTIAPLIGKFYDNDSLILGTRLSCTVVMFQSVSIIATAKLFRDLAFKEIAIISIISSFWGLMVAVIWAYYIGGYFALIAQSLVTVILNSVGQLWITKSIPHLRFSKACFKRQFSFGINLMGATILQSFSSNISHNMIAKFFNVNLAGIFIQSYKLQNVSVSIVQGIIDKTFFPILSKISENSELIINESRRISRMTYAVCFPIFSVLVFFSKPIVLILLGEQWLYCTKIFQMLMLSSYPLLAKIVNRNILKALGFTKDILYIELIPSIFLVLFLVVSSFLKSYFLFVFVVIMYSFLSSLISFVYIKKRLGVSIIQLTKDFLEFFPFLFISVINIAINNYEHVYYLLNILILVVLFALYIVNKNYEFVSIKNYIFNKGCD